MTFTSSAGDCEDYALAKYAALRELGYRAEELRMIVTRDNDAHEYHMVLAVQHEGHWLILDNKTLEIRGEDIALSLHPLFVLDGSGVRHVAAFDKPANFWAAHASADASAVGPLEYAANFAFGSPFVATLL